MEELTAEQAAARVLSVATLLKDGRLQCCACPFVAFSVEETLQHLHKTHGLEHQFDCSLTYSCPVCHVQFKSFKGMRQHVGKVHERRYRDKKCKDCGAKFKSKYALRFHVRQVHEGTDRTPCPLCEKVLYNKYRLKHHLAKSHPSSG